MGQAVTLHIPKNKIYCFDLKNAGASCNLNEKLLGMTNLESKN